MRDNFRRGTKETRSVRPVSLDKGKVDIAVDLVRLRGQAASEGTAQLGGYVGCEGTSIQRGGAASKGEQQQRPVSSSADGVGACREIHQLIGLRWGLKDGLKRLEDSRLMVADEEDSDGRFELYDGYGVIDLVRFS